MQFTIKKKYMKYIYMKDINQTLKYNLILKD